MIHFNSIFRKTLYEVCGVWVQIEVRHLDSECAN